MTDFRLRVHLAVLSTALESYLVQLRRRWNAPASDELDAEIRRLLGGVGAGPVPAHEDVERVAGLLAAAAEGPLPRISAALGLSAGEEALVASAWWSEADPQLAIVLGCAHDDATRRYASAGLLHLLLEPYGIECPVALDDDSVLVATGVLQAGAGANGPLHLTPTARLLLAGELPRPLEPDQPLPSRFEPTVEALARRLSSGAGVVVVLRGAAGVGRRACAATAAERAGLVPVGGDRPGPELRLGARTRTAVPIVDAAIVSELGWSERDGPLVAIARPGESVAGGYVVELPSPDFGERRRLWAAALDAEELPGDTLVDALATRFAFTDRDIAQAIERARADASWRSLPLELGDVWEAARRQPEHALERLAALVPPVFTFDDLVLPDERMAQLRELVSHVELQHVVLDEWGFRRRMPRGRGVIALFSGPPGTGKTTAAEAVAHALRQDLYRVDLSAVVSKYIGETEKNLASAFDEAERASAVLFFDEADSLFGKRTEVKDAHDRYANLEVNYLLQRIETFTGLVLLATNRHSALDEAFARRLRFLIRFEHPDRTLRADLWRRSFPGDTRVDGLDWAVLAAPELTGGSIQNAALAAAYLAAASGAAVQTTHVEHALRREHEKLGKSFAGLFLEAER
jgi:ATPase family associated with various cellular activities (AAA)